MNSFAKMVGLVALDLQCARDTDPSDEALAQMAVEIVERIQSGEGGPGVDQRGAEPPQVEPPSPETFVAPGYESRTDFNPDLLALSELLKQRLYPVMDVKRLTLTEAAAIISVVEAAEEFRDSRDWAPGYSEHERLFLSLTALQEHLEGQ